MMKYELLEDLVREILSRLPVVSLIRLRSTCKQWNFIFKDPEFTKKQFNKSKEYMLVSMNKHGVSLMNINELEGFDYYFKSKRIILKDSYYNSDQDGIFAVCSCDGLLVCTAKNKIRNDSDVARLVVWNPCLGHTRWIELGKVSYSRWDSFVLGYDSNKKYKILRISSRNGCVTKKWFEIYDFNLNSWKVLDEDVISDGWGKSEHFGVSLSGNTYWICYEGKSSTPHLEKFREWVETDDSAEGFFEPMLISFDYSAAKFQRHCLPPCFRLSRDSMALSVARRERLLLLHQSSRALKTDIWVTTNDKIDHTKVLTWSKFLTLDLYTRSIPISDWTRFFIMDDEKKIVF